MPAMHNATHKTKTVMYQAVQGFRFTDLQRELARIRRGGMPERTLREWMSRLGMHPDAYGYYDQSDLELLKRLHRHLQASRRNRISQFVQQVTMEGIYAS